MNWKTSAGVTSVDYMLAVLDDAYQDFSWAIWHEGVRTFDDGDPGSIRGIEMVRLEAIKKWVHDAEAQELIRVASAKQLVQYVHLTRARVYSEFQLAVELPMGCRSRGPARGIWDSSRAAEFQWNQGCLLWVPGA